MTTYYVGAHYQVDNGVVTKYYLAGAQRVAMRKNGTLYYLLADHLGSTSLTTNTSGAIVSELRYKASPLGEGLRPSRHGRPEVSALPGCFLHGRLSHRRRGQRSTPS